MTRCGRILLVEDEADLAAGIREICRPKGTKSRWRPTVPRAWNAPSEARSIW